jgi:two component regulator with propeller domain
MDKKTMKIAMQSMLALAMIATIYYSNSLRDTFYDGRTQYLRGTSPKFVTNDSSGQPWIVDEAGKWQTFEEDKLIPRTYHGFRTKTTRAFDHEGNLWIASNGLHKFVGKTETRFTTQNSDLVSNNVTSVAIDNSDRVWVTYESGGGFSASGVTVLDGNTWTTFTTENSGLISNEVTAVAFDSENRAWLGTTHGISIFDGKKWSYLSAEEIGFQHQLLIPEIFFGQPGRIWIQNSGEVRIFDDGQWIGLAEEDGDLNNVNSLATDKEGNILIANGNDRGLVRLNSDYPLASAWRTQPQRIFFSSGGIWFVAFILACLCIAILLDSVATVALALLGGVFIFIFWAGIVHDPRVVYFLPFVNPGIYAAVGATMGAFADTLIAVRGGTSNRRRFMIMGFVVSVVIGIGQVLPLLLAQ